MSDRREAGMPAEILVYGARTCEDTAIARSRLQALGAPFRELDVDDDPAALARVVALEGHRVTPTIVFGDGRTVVAEPSIETLDELVRADGLPVEPPAPRQVHGALADRPIPLRTLSRAAGGELTPEAWRGRYATAVLFAHDAACLACHGYAKQLARQADPMREADALPLVVVRDAPEAAGHWAEELPEGTQLLADPGGAWTHAVQPLIAADPGDVVLLVLDRYAAPRVVSVAGEAGGLAGPAEVTEWLRYLALECPECGNDVRWPE
jgi:glutaredoxin